MKKLILFLGLSFGIVSCAWMQMDSPPDYHSVPRGAAITEIEGNFSAGSSYQVAENQITLLPGFERLLVDGNPNVPSAVGWASVSGGTIPDAINGAFSGFGGARAFYGVRAAAGLKPAKPQSLSNVWSGIIQESQRASWRVYEDRSGQINVDEAGNFSAQIGGYQLSGKLNGTEVKGTAQRGNLSGMFTGYYGLLNGSLRSYGGFAVTNGNQSISGIWR